MFTSNYEYYCIYCNFQITAFYCYFSDSHCIFQPRLEAVVVCEGDGSSGFVLVGVVGGLGAGAAHFSKGELAILPPSADSHTSFKAFTGLPFAGSNELERFSALSAATGMSAAAAEMGAGCSLP